MKNKYNNHQYRIKVNRISSESEKIYPFNQYPKTNSLNLRKVHPKNSIFHRDKFNPEIIINEYHQTSNNINTNINIRTNQSENSNINNTSSNNISYKGRGNNKSSNKFYQEFPVENYINDDNSNNNGSYIDRSTNKDKNSKNNDNASNRYNNNENSSSKIFSPFSNYEYYSSSRDNGYKKRNVNHIKINDLNKNNNKLSNCMFSPREEYSIIKKIQANNDSYSITNTEIDVHSNFEKNIGRQRENNSQEEVKATNDLKYIKRKNPSFNIRNKYNTTNSNPSQSNMETLRTKKMKEMNEIVFSSGKKINSIFRNRFNKKIENLIVNKSNDNNDYNKESLNIKLEYYRVKLFKEFFKHFKIFYLSYIGKIFRLFLKNLYFFKSHNRNDYIYSKKSYFRHNNSIENGRRKKENILDINNSHGQNLIEVFKSSTMNDYYKLYNQFKKNKIMDPNIKRIINNYSLNKDKTNLDSNNYQNINNISSPSINQYYLNSAPRIYKNLDYLSVKRKPEKGLFTSNSKSPSFRIGNKTIINNDISFGIEGNEKEKELFRDTNELKKKYEQILRRKKSSKSKNRDMSWEINMSKTSDRDNIKNSEEYNEFSKLRNHIQNLKSNGVKRNYLNIGRNNKAILQMNSLESEIDNNSIENANNKEDKEEQNNNSIYSKTFYSYSIKKNQLLNKNENRETNTKVNKERKNAELRKNKDNINSKYIFTNISTVNHNETLKKETSDDLMNKNEEEKKYKKFKVNINKKKVIHNESNTIENQTNKINKKIVNSNSKLNNSLKTKNNIYYTKRNNINNNNDNNKDTNKFISSLIKNINTKDNRIHINIFYYPFSYNSKYPKKKRRRFYGLKKINKTCICLICEMELIKNNLMKFKNKLGSIKEEDISNQNSKIYDENSTLGNNYISDKKNNISDRNQLMYSKFIDMISNIFKKYFMKNMKKLNRKKNDVKKEENNNNNKNIKNRIYTKRNRYKKNIALKEGC